jgi:GNAT superfamily N-acetyltransferase
VKRSLASVLRRGWHEALRRALHALPRELRFWIYRWLVDCDPAPDPRLQLKIAETREELEACFAILHDAYVGSGFMQPHPSGLRVTPYHALPTTTTLCATWEGQVVGTLSLIREGVFGFPLQSIFDLAPVRARGGRIAEISALAVHPAFRKTGGTVLFPLMKFMYEYCTAYFDTRHLVIAVNPNKAELYESLLFFERLQERMVDRYDFANGAPAVGATLDLLHAPEIFRRAYGGRRERKNLHRYFASLRMPNIVLPQRRYHTTNDPVLTPEILDHFFNRRVPVFPTLDTRRARLLHSIYDDLEAYRAVLPPLPQVALQTTAVRRHQRYSIKCPAQIAFDGHSTNGGTALQVIELSLHGFQAEAAAELPLRVPGQATVELGADEHSVVRATAVRRHEAGGSVFYGFYVAAPDATWRACVEALQRGQTHRDLATDGPL